MKRLLIASTNPGKISELKFGLKILSERGITILTLNDVRVGDKKPEESGKTFSENALIKAKFYSEKSKLPVIADDGGLIIPYLNNEPGVKSRRWLGYDASDQELVDYTLERLSGAKPADRKAYLETCICYYNPETGQPIYESEKISGTIAKTPFSKRTPGFPYRDLLIVDQFKKYYDELTPEEHTLVNHRLIALKRLTKRIIDLIS